MRRHKTEGMDAISETLDAFLEQHEKPRAVTRIEKDILAAIAAMNDMVNGAGIMKSRFAWHARKCRRESPFVKLDPFVTQAEKCAFSRGGVVLILR